jgi:protein-disulfide isomerase
MNARATKTTRTATTGTAREKAAAMRAGQARAQARRRSIVVTALVAVMVVLAVTTFVLVQSSRREDTASATVPAHLTGGTSVVVGKADAPVTVVAYEDFQCPACGAFERSNDAQLKAWVAAGTVRIEYRPIAFLDRASTDDYSTRALNAAAAVVDSAPAAFEAFHDALFAEQPAEGGPGLSDARLIDLAVAAGAPRPPVAAAVRDLTYRAWAARVTDDSSKAGVTQTPTVQVAGRTLRDHDPATVRAAVRAAESAG